MALTKRSLWKYKRKKTKILMPASTWDAMCNSQTYQKNSQASIYLGCSLAAAALLAAFLDPLSKDNSQVFCQNLNI